MSWRVTLDVKNNIEINGRQICAVSGSYDIDHADELEAMIRKLEEVQQHLPHKIGQKLEQAS